MTRRTKMAERRKLARSRHPGAGSPLRIAGSIAVVLLVAAGIWAMSGCGPGTDRLEISGHVTLDGVPLDSGSIRFTSLESEQLLVSGAMIQDGAYRIAREKGLRPGFYHVEISAPDNSASPVMTLDAPGTRGIPVAPERIPPEFNVDSRQRIEVKIDGANRFDFDIVSKSAN